MRFKFPKPVDDPIASLRGERTFVTDLSQDQGSELVAQYGSLVQLSPMQGQTQPLFHVMHSTQMRHELLEHRNLLYS